MVWLGQNYRSSLNSVGNFIVRTGVRQVLPLAQIRIDSQMTPQLLFVRQLVCECTFYQIFVAEQFPEMCPLNLHTLTENWCDCGCSAAPINLNGGERWKMPAGEV